MKIHQIFITDDNKLPSKLPPYMNICVEQIQKVHPGWEYKLYSGEEIEKIIKDNFPDDVYWSYKKLRPYACKCDLARACLLYLYGGLYADISILFVDQISRLDRWQFFAFRDKTYASQRFWSVMNSIMYAKDPGCRVLKHVIDRIVKHCQSDYYGGSPIDVTATTVLGRSIMKESDIDDNNDVATLGQLYGVTDGQKEEYLKTYKDIFEQHENFSEINSAFFMDMTPTEDYKLVAFYKPTLGGDLKSLGYEKVNNYIDMWHNKEIYGEKKDSFWRYV
jgi:hypothetical protein